jgi:hypothetical protein
LNAGANGEYLQNWNPAPSEDRFDQLEGRAHVALSVPAGAAIGVMPAQQRPCITVADPVLL